MNQKFIDLSSVEGVLADTNFLHVISTEGDKKIKASDFARCMFNILTNNHPEAHNFITRGSVVLTNKYSLEQIYQKIAASDFSDIFIGDIIEAQTPAITETSFTAKKAQYAVIGINSLKNHGDTPKLQSKPHLVLMPLDGLGSAKMNNENVTTGGYKSSYMNTTVMPAVVKALENAFGTEHVLQTREYITTEVTGTTPSRAGLGWQGASTKGEWSDQKAILMTEMEAYGATPFSSSAYDNIGLDEQLPGMRLDYVMNRRFDRWLRSVCYSTGFCYVGGHGIPNGYNASHVCAVCPRFAIG